MDVRKTAGEIGLFETAVNLAKFCKSDDVVQKAAGLMPLPDESAEARVGQAARWLCGFKKRKYMFLTPEIALIEEMGRQADSHTEFIIAISCGLEQEAEERLKNNLPRGVDVTVLEEPYFPKSFFPGNGILVICGYLGGNRAMVLPDTYRMAGHYSGFFGKKVFVPYMELDTATRYDGWMEISRQKLNAEWRSET